MAMTTQEMAFMCKRCAADPHPEHFATPRKCAFPNAGLFSPDNWNCATLDALMAEAVDHEGFDESMQIIRRRRNDYGRRCYDAGRASAEAALSALQAQVAQMQALGLEACDEWQRLLKWVEGGDDPVGRSICGEDYDDLARIRKHLETWGK